MHASIKETKNRTNVTVLAQTHAQNECRAKMLLYTSALAAWKTMIYCQVATSLLVVCYLCCCPCGLLKQQGSLGSVMLVLCCVFRHDSLRRGLSVMWKVTVLKGG
jgi:hypothetical protein